MHRLLLITRSYPPTENSGTRRPAALAKYLPRFGWEVVVLTPKVEGFIRDGGVVIETDYRDVVSEWKARLHLDRKRALHDQFHLPVSSQPGGASFHTLALTLCKNFLTYPDSHKGWIPYAVKAIEELRRTNQPIDAILTTSPPISSQLIGAKAKQILRRPWIADFRDLWTQDITTVRTRDLRFLQVGLEKATLRDADLLVTVSDPWADRLKQRYSSKEVCAIPNGFDPDDFLSPPPLTREFSITHAGVLHDCRRNPAVLFEVLRDLIQEGILSASEIRVRFYGPIEAALSALIREYKLEQVVELKGVTPRREVLQREMESQVLLLLTWTHPKDTGLHTGKLFEYLGATRPILAVGGSRGSMTQVLEETRAGRHALSKEEIREFLTRAYSDYKQLGYVPYGADGNSVARYTHLEMARRFAGQLDRLRGESQEHSARPTGHAIQA